MGASAPIDGNRGHWAGEMRRLHGGPTGRARLVNWLLLVGFVVLVIVTVVVLVS